MKLTLTLIALIALLSPASAIKIDSFPATLKCGEEIYSNMNFVCADGKLCPAAAPLRCGGDCYSPKEYYCIDGVIKHVIYSMVTSTVTAMPEPTTTTVTVVVVSFTASELG